MTPIALEGTPKITNIFCFTATSGFKSESNLLKSPLLVAIPKLFRQNNSSTFCDPEPFKELEQPDSAYLRTTLENLETTTDFRRSFF